MSTLIAKENSYYGNEFVFAIAKNPMITANAPAVEIELNIFSNEIGNEVEVYFAGRLLLDTLLSSEQSLSYPLTQIKDIEIFGKSNISDKVLRVECSKPATANVISSAYNSADATSLIPTSHCGKEYTLSSFQDGAKNKDPLDTNNYYGFGLVIGLEDGATVNISTDSKIFDGSKDVSNLNLTLQRGQVFYFTSGFDSDYDITGTRIISDKKIAVISGHRFSRILDIANSRDFLINQVVPDNSNGTEYVIGNFHRKDVEYLPIFRVISLHDSNKVSFNNQSFTLNKGTWRQFMLDSLTLLKSEKPVIVAEYMKTLPEFILGDPFLLTLTPTQQFVNSYAYTVPSVREITKHYVAITCSDTIMSKISMNGQLLDISKFDKVNGSGFSYGVFPVYTDSVVINSEYDFGAIAFGVGTLDSYGMNLGSNLRNIENIILDKTVANVSLDNCSGQIRIADTSEFVSGMELVEYYNAINLDKISLSSNSSGVTLSYELVDERKDAQISVIAVDSSQNRIDTTISIKGFTIEPYLNIPDELGLMSLENWELKLINTGNFPQNLTFQLIDGRLVALPAGLRQKSIEVGKSDSILLYSYSDDGADYIDTLYIYNECGRVIKLPIAIHFGFETSVTTKCDADYLITDKFHRNGIVLLSQLYDTAGKLLESSKDSFDMRVIADRYKGMPLILKVYYKDRIELSKVIFDN
jgi:hypothetical protein